VPRRFARRLQSLSERVCSGRKPPVLVAQPFFAPHEVLRFGIGEDDSAIFCQKKNGETRGRDRRAKRIG
jgi:hypothetical protein